MDSMRNQSRTAVYVVAVVAALLVGTVLAPMAWEQTAEPDGTVAVVSLEGSITPGSAETVVEDLNRARNNESIDAVVLRVNSPGGAVGASESLYLAVRQTAAEKPVVANVAGTAASGGYMALLGSDYVYTTPSSKLGSVGVYGVVPPMQLSDVEGVVTTAPTKGTSGTPQDVRESIERMKQTFVGLVVEERGENLTVDRATIGRAKVYNGNRAVENGFADEIGGRQAAIGTAADRAGLDDYRVVTRNTEPTGIRSLLAGDGVDTTRYLALHGIPDAAATTPLETVSANVTGTERATGAVAAGRDDR